ncbi:stress response translation initiation inhibitor YciH [Aquabacterium sp. OR-4]|uniref:stress response translation initiation inhibitor YciH n=1 Tax=Aquabacterium sp. OR-4 TaxID=2978127 RepID=UPI0021B1A01C|nr:stress response translation initiation inhibitor YciH [Aquabacterium sp. OR-4]MDT7837942.1 stress response translation initiation inhibitor YciH [Aquabacterium sp. OR-4]
MPSMKLKTAGSGGLVYSTEAGAMCPACRQPLAACLCKTQAAAAAPRGDGTVRVGFETKGRGGKAVTVVRGLDDLTPDMLAQWGKQLRTACGAGGAVKDGTLEIQGDHRAKVLAWLQAQGRKAKLAGG